MFGNRAPGRLVSIRGSSPRGDWEHKAFVPDPLDDHGPELAGATYRAVADARAALAALDNTARQLPDPTLFRWPALRREAQSTSALEGTSAPLVAVLEADEDSPSSVDMIEILNYVRMANHGFDWIGDDRPLTTSVVTELQKILMNGTQLESSSGRLRDIQVAIGVREGVEITAPAIHAARFVPPPPGDELEAGMRALVDWINTDHRGDIDPVVAAAMAHYQFEALHPFRDGNGRVGRFLIVLHLMRQGVLVEPTLTVSPWFEARRADYYDHLLGVSTTRDWDGFVSFFARGLRAAADLTHRQLLALREVQEELRERVRQSRLRAETAVALVDFAVSRPSFTVRQASQGLGVSYPRANELVGQLVDLGVFDVVHPNAYNRRFFAPSVIEVLTAGAS